MLSQQGYRFDRRALLLATSLALLAAALMFLPGLVSDGFRLTLFADYDEQQIPFNLHALDVVKSGRFGWDWSVDLGTPFAGAFGFYNLGSPFFWVSTLFSAAWFPYLAGLLYILKYAAAAAAAYVFAARYTRYSSTAVLVALLYAFSGFNQINLMYFHFHDVVALFPLLLWATDRLVLDRRYGLLAPVLALNALVNYFFFFGEVIFLLLYFAIRHVPDLIKRRQVLPVTMHALAEGVAGVLLASVLLLPSFLFVLRSPRQIKTGFGTASLKYETERYLLLLKGFVLPAEAMADQAAFVRYDFSSNASYLPLIGPALLFVRSTSIEKWTLRLLGVSAALALVPIGNSLFYNLNQQYYARWFYMPVLVLALRSGLVLERADSRRIYRGVLPAAGLAAAVVLAAWFWQAEEKRYLNARILLISLLISLSGLAVTLVILRAFKTPRQRIAILLAAAACAGTLTGLYSISLLRARREARVPQDEKFVDVDLREQLKLSVSELSDNERIHVNRQGSNLQMLLDMPGTNSFISTISPALFAFYDAVGINRHVSTPLIPEPLPLASALSAAVFVRRHEEVADTLRKLPELHHAASFAGKSERLEQFENPYAVPLGFTQSYVLPYSAFMRESAKQRRRLLLKALIVDDADLGLVDDVLMPLPDAARQTDWHVDALDRKDGAPLAFKRDHRGFEAVYKQSKETVAWFSVPHEPGWQATVNGIETSIIDSLHMMAIKLPAGESTVSFRYTMPGARGGWQLSAAGLLAWLILIWAGSRRKKAKNSESALPAPLI